MGKNLGNIHLLLILAFSVACTKKVNKDKKDAKVTVTSSGVVCEYNASFQVFGSQNFIANYTSGGPHEIEYKCLKDGSLVTDVECRPVSLESMANSVAFSPCASEGIFSVPQNLLSGLYNVAIKATNPETGIPTDDVILSFAIDNQAPIVANSVIELAKSTQSFTIDFQWTEPTSPTSPASGIKSVQCVLTASETLPANPDWEDCSSTQFSADASDGLQPGTEYWVWFRLEDKAGNVNLESNVGIKNYKVKTNEVVVVNPGTPGPCQISTTFPSGFTSDVAANLQYSCPNNQLINKCVLYSPGQNPLVSDGENETAFQNCDETAYQTPLPQEGAYTFCVADGAGGVARCLSFGRDTAEPSVNITQVNASANTAVIQFEGTDALSGIDRFTCALHNRVTDKVFDAAGSEVASIGGALDDASVPCGQVGVSQSSVTFDLSITGSLADYTIYVAAFDKAGLRSNPDNEGFLAGPPSNLLCLLTDRKDGAWLASAPQVSNFECSYDEGGPAVFFSCSVENLSIGKTSSVGCNAEAPLCNAGHCVVQGQMRTEGLASNFLSSGDQLKVKVTATQKYDSGEVYAIDSDEDSFKLDLQAPVFTQLMVHSNSQEVQVSYAANDPGAPTRGSGLRGGVQAKVFEIFYSPEFPEGRENEITDFDLTVMGTNLYFGPRNFNPAKDYRIKVIVEDNVGHSTSAQTLKFPGPNRFSAPSCQLSFVDGYSVDPADPTSAAQTKVLISCLNSFEEAPWETDHTSRAWCRITSKDRFGDTHYDIWRICRGDNKNIENENPFLWSIGNGTFYTGPVTLETYACDSTYSYRCGPISTLTYYYERP